MPVNGVVGTWKEKKTGEWQSIASCQWLGGLLKKRTPSASYFYRKGSFSVNLDFLNLNHEIYFRNFLSCTEVLIKVLFFITNRFGKKLILFQFCRDFFRIFGWTRIAVKRDKKYNLFFHSVLRLQILVVVVTMDTQVAVIQRPRCYEKPRGTFGYKFWIKLHKGGENLFMITELYHL